MTNKGVKELEKSISKSSYSDFKVTGISIQYATVCKRELWFYIHGVDIDRSNTHIATGASVDNRFYKNSESFIFDSMIAPDILENGKIIEVKPSSSNSSAPKNQLLYYLWYLDKFYNDKREGVLAYPTERKRTQIELTEENKKKIEGLILSVYNMYQSESPPKFKKKPVCDSCAYKDICQVKK